MQVVKLKKILFSMEGGMWRLAHYIVLKASILDIQHSVFDPDSIRWLEYGKVRIMLEYGIRA